MPAPEETAALRQAYADGIAWGDAKQLLFERIDREDRADARALPGADAATPARSKRILLAGAAKAAPVATPFMGELRHAVGLRDLRAPASSQSSQSRQGRRCPAFKQYRENDGKFYFKLVDAEGRLLLQSQGFDSPKEAALTIAALQKEGARPRWPALQDKVATAPQALAHDELAAALKFFAPAAPYRLNKRHATTKRPVVRPAVFNSGS